MGKLVVVGSVAFDSVETPRGRHEQLLGGSASFVSVAASYFAMPHLVAIVGADFPDLYLEILKSRGIDLAGLERVPGKTFHWSGKYSPDLTSRTTLDTQLNVFAGFKPNLPQAYRDADLVFLGNIAPDLQLDVLSQVSKPRLVGMDTMNFWIEGRPDDLRKVLAKVDFILLNDEEARQLAREHNLPRAARAIQAMGPKSVIVKRGDSGALLFHDGSVFAAPAYPLEEVIDPTGAGDSFAGGFMGYLAKQNDFSPATIKQAMIYGSVMASFSVEAFSLDRMRNLDAKEIRSRYRAFCELTQFEGPGL